MVITPARRAGDPGSNPGPDENFSLKLLIYDLSEGYSKAKISLKLAYIDYTTRKTCDERSAIGPFLLKDVASRLEDSGINDMMQRINIKSKFIYTF